MTLAAFSGRIPSQNEAELRGFIRLLQHHKVTAYLEIGAREGDTFHEIMTSLPAGSRGVAVDLPGGLWGKTTTRAKLERAVADLCRRGYRASCLFGDSKTAATQSIVRLRGPYDAVLIDGDHTYEGVHADWLAYGHIAKLTAFHDIVGVGQSEKKHGRPVEVPRLWAELRQSGANVVEFVEDGSKMGIGVVIA